MDEYNTIRIHNIGSLIDALNNEAKNAYMIDYVNIWEASFGTKYDNFGIYYEKEIFEPLQQMSDIVLELVDKEIPLIFNSEGCIGDSLRLISAMRCTVQSYLLYNNISDKYERKSIVLEKMNDIDQILETRYNQIWRSYFTE